MPGFKSSIKERMLYSSCKAPLLEYCEQKLAIVIDKKVVNSLHILSHRLYNYVTFIL